MTRFLLSLVALVLLITSSVRAEPQKEIPVKVDRRIELLSIVFRLAGNSEYNMPNSKSKYSDEVEAYFGRFRDHEVVKLAGELRNSNGVSYDAVMSMAVHLDDQLPPGPRTPLSPRPALLESRWTDSDAQAFITALDAFVKDTDAAKFFDAHSAFYDQCAQRLSAVVNNREIVPFFDDYFGKRPTASYTVIVGMLNGGGNYGVSMRHADGREEITPVIGVYRWDPQGLPAIGEEVRDTIIHEFCHAYTNAIVDKHWTELERSCGTLFDHTAATMRRHAYGNAKTLGYESFVRACVSRAMANLYGEKVGSSQAIREACSGFAWTPDFAEVLKQYEADRKSYADFEAFVPQVVAFFDKTAGDYDAMLKRFPQIVSISPADGESKVDAAKTTEIRITFDRPMRDKSWSVVTLDRSQFPKIGKPSFDAAHKVLTIPATLEAGHAYRFGLNGPNFLGFVAEDGMPLLPVEVKFKTAG